MFIFSTVVWRLFPIYNSVCNSWSDTILCRFSHIRPFVCTSRYKIFWWFVSLLLQQLYKLGWFLLIWLYGRFKYLATFKPNLTKYLLEWLGELPVSLYVVWISCSGIPRTTGVHTYNWLYNVSILEGSSLCILKIVRRGWLYDKSRVTNSVLGLGLFWFKFSFDMCWYRVQWCCGRNPRWQLVTGWIPLMMMKRKSLSLAFVIRLLLAT